VRRKVLSVFLTLGLSWQGAPIFAQAVSDAEVARGIRYVNEGDYDRAILVLDGAARRLSSAPGDARELAQAYLYLGIAYFAKGHTASAKARFRDAVRHDPGLSLRPEEFAPKVVELVEVAREEVAKAAPPPSSSPTVGEKKGSKKGGTETFTSSLSNPANQTGPPATNQDPRVWFTILTPRGSGAFTASVTWNTSDATLELYLFEGPARGQPRVAASKATGSTTAKLSTSVTAQQYQLNVFYARCRTAQCPVAPFSLTVTHP
jgi:tetratricopeptide (TPR) repeat protein